jgi:hypothetical protein
LQPAQLLVELHKLLLDCPKSQIKGSETRIKQSNTHRLISILKMVGGDDCSAAMFEDNRNKIKEKWI